MSETCTRRKDHFDAGSFGIGLVVGVLVGLILATVIGPDIPFSAQREAVKHGAAVWAADADGDHEFKWKDEALQKLNESKLAVAVDPFGIAVDLMLSDSERFMATLRERVTKVEGK